ncbi:P-loop ATPase, Sll1717 family [Acidovorax sp. Root219]|uniref:P-loop ATPase, Sll1717 family n=1 Tax=Acidovorax sp. Root219 TaxID=1736493 RepID=UPI0007095178|nr:hypothetical protein [Acidovorax sp. Root219]KRC20173.1 ATPase [Acidovorax sp. Root219]
MTSILDWIEFGTVAAERDALLSSYFFDNGVLDKVSGSPTSFLVLGRKGAGKTAVFRHFTANSGKFVKAPHLTVALSFDDYNWNIHSLLSDNTKAESLRYKHSWRFVILVQSLLAIDGWYESSGLSRPKPIANAMKLVKKIYGDAIPGLLAVVGAKLLSIAKLKLPSAGLDLSTDGVEGLAADVGEVSFDEVKGDDSLRAKLSENIDNLISSLDRALSSTRGSWPTVFICFDRVDEAWDADSFDLSRKVIAGLVSASDSVNSQYGGMLRPIVFLREDIFETLSLNDKNKLREDCGALLHWNRETISHLIMRRVNYFASARGALPVAEIDALFDRSEMRQGLKPSKYLLRRTMMRPRDLISLLNKTVQTMKEEAKDPFSDEVTSYPLLECEAIYRAEPAYSEWLKEELLDEWKVQRPIIEKLFQALQHNGSTNFVREDLERELKKIDQSIEPSSLSEHLKFLFENSVIGFRLGTNQEWKFKCFYPTQGFVESEEYKVHDGLVRGLNLTESRKREDAGPLPGR